MSVLNRELAPLSEAAWSEIDSEARSTLRVMLAGRKLVDFAGPKGWNFSAVSTGRVEGLEAGLGNDVAIRKRQVLSLIELRREFDISRTELDAIDRGAASPDLDPVVEACRDVAFTEDSAIFNGLPEAGISGIISSSVHDPLEISEDYENFPSVVAHAATVLRNAGVAGPYAIALGSACYTGLSEVTVNGFPVMKHVEALLDGPIVSAPAIDGATVLSCRGEDFEFTAGRDLSIGYLDHSSTTVKLFIEESFTFQVPGPDAAVPLIYRKSARRG